MTLQAWHTRIGGNSNILLCRSSQAVSGWMGSVAAQQISGLSKDDRSGSSLGSGWATQGNSVLKPLLHCLGYVLIVVVLLEGEPSLQSALGSRFSSRISLNFSPFKYASILTSHPVPATEKYPHSMILPPPCFTVGMVPGFLQK